ncbi:MAG: hypothetical protein DHS20C01_27820 [marine bacterium B5-7]|nr:MAG: hypothetical protein DHS20C01_27820 [marine bacterium B5-7]
MIQESGQNADNQANNRPYITYVINGDEVQFEFFNPTNFSFAFDYRVDQEPGTTINGLSEIVISQGELAGEMIGDVYNLTSVPANSSVMVMVTGTSEIRAGLRVGAEQEWYLDWIIFQAIQVTIP